MAKVAEAAVAPPAPDDLTTNLPWLLAHASHVLSTEMAAAFESLGVPPRGHCILSVAASGEFTQKDLVEKIGIDKTTMVVTVDELEAAGLAERVPSPTDRRARQIKVTPAGKKLVARGEKLVNRIQEDVLGSLPAAERKALMSALNRLTCDRLSSPAACSRAPRRRAA